MSRVASGTVFAGPRVRWLGAAWLFFALSFGQFIEARHWHGDLDDVPGYCHICLQLDVSDLASGADPAPLPMAGPGCSLSPFIESPALRLCYDQAIRAPPAS